MPWWVACRLEGMGCTKMINDLDARIAASKVHNKHVVDLTCQPGLVEPDSILMCLISDIH